jgi:hypothetical protein
MTVRVIAFHRPEPVRPVARCAEACHTVTGPTRSAAANLLVVDARPVVVVDVCVCVCVCCGGEKPASRWRMTRLFQGEVILGGALGSVDCSGHSGRVSFLNSPERTSAGWPRSRMCFVKRKTALVVSPCPRRLERGVEGRPGSRFSGPPAPAALIRRPAAALLLLLRLWRR